MQRLLVALGLGCLCLGSAAADFRWGHALQAESDPELQRLYRQMTAWPEVSEARTEGFSLQRPAFTLTLGAGRILVEKPVPFGVGGLYFTGTASVSFRVDDPFERDNLRRCRGTEALEAVPVSSVFILPLGPATDLPALSGVPFGTVDPELADLKSVFHFGGPDWLEAILNAPMASPKNILVLFRIEKELWGYRYDAGAPEEVSLLRFGDALGRSYFHWDVTVSLHERPDGTLVRRISAEEVRGRERVDVLDYDLDYSLDRKGQLTAGRAKVRLVLSRPTSALSLSLTPFLNVRRVSLGEAGGMPFLKEGASERWEWVENGLLVCFPRPTQGPVTLDFELEGDLFKSAGAGFLNLRDEDDWYPRLSDWDGATFGLRATVPEGFETLTVGESLGREGPVEGRVVHRHRIDSRVRLATLLFGEFVHERMEVEGVSVDVALPASTGANLLRQAQEASLNELKNALRFYTKLFGPLSTRSLTVGVTSRAHGRGFPTLLLLSMEAFYRTGSTWQDQFIAHEVAHQWWGNGVAPLTYRDVWIAEGLCQFASLQYMSVRHDRDTLRRYLEQMGPGMRRGGGVEDEAPVDRSPLCLGERLFTHIGWGGGGYTSIVYNKGAFLMLMLHQFAKFSKAGALGLYGGLQDFQSQYAGGRASTEDLRACLEKRMGMPLDWFFRQWYEGTGLPRVQVETRVEEAGGAFTLVAEARQTSDFILGIPVEVRGKGGSKEMLFLLKGRTGQARWALPEKPQEIAVDPTRVVLCTYGSVKE